MRASQKKQKPEVLVVAYEAGGSEVIAAYIKKHKDQKIFHIYAGGPAARIFRREHLHPKRIEDTQESVVGIVERHRNVEFVLTGTGVETKIEFRAIKESKRRGLKTFAYLDSWVNYRERFRYPHKKWKEDLPDELWVGDKYALLLARRLFHSSMRIRYVKNEYFGGIVERFNKSVSQFDTAKQLLFLSLGLTPGVQEIFGELLYHLSRTKNPPTVRVRFHPFDQRDRYDKLIKQYRGKVRVIKSKEKDIVSDLLYARVVVGTETVAMVAAVLAGRRTISIRTPGKKPELPFPKIIHVHSAKEAVNSIET